jgi:hypothetical protein
MDATRARLGHFRRDPRVSLTVLDKNSWYSHVSLTGVVDRLVDDTELADIDRLALRYARSESAPGCDPNAGTAGLIRPSP